MAFAGAPASFLSPITPVMPLLAALDGVSAIESIPMQAEQTNRPWSLFSMMMSRAPGVALTPAEAWNVRAVADDACTACTEMFGSCVVWPGSVTRKRPDG